MCQTKKKHDSLVLSRCDLWIVWRWHGVLRVHCYYFCLEPTVRKDTWMRTASVTVIVMFAQSVHLEEYCTKIETTFHLFCAFFFLTNLVFKFNIVLIGICFFDKVNHNLICCLSIKIWYILKFIYCLCGFL